MDVISLLQKMPLQESLESSRQNSFCDFSLENKLQISSSPSLSNNSHALCSKLFSLPRDLFCTFFPDIVSGEIVTL